jgi:hypothetical protein
MTRHGTTWHENNDNDNDNGGNDNNNKAEQGKARQRHLHVFLYNLARGQVETVVFVQGYMRNQYINAVIAVTKHGENRALMMMRF